MLLYKYVVLYKCDQIVKTSCNPDEQQPFRVEHSNKDPLAKFDQSEWGKWRLFLAEALIEASGLQKWVQTNGMAGMPESPRDESTNRIKWEHECSTTWTKLSLNLHQTRILLGRSKGSTKGIYTFICLCQHGVTAQRKTYLKRLAAVIPAIGDYRVFAFSNVRKML